MVDRRRTWGEDRVYYYDHCELKRMPAAWTSAASPDPFVAVSAGRALFRLEDLLELSSLIGRLRELQRPGRRPAKRRSSTK